METWPRIVCKHCRRILEHSLKCCPIEYVVCNGCVEDGYDDE